MSSGSWGRYDNIKVDDEGNVWRIDAGGALLYRAMGAPKGNEFGDEVGELKTMRDKYMNAQPAKVFGGITNAEMKEQAARLAAITPDEIRDLVEALTTWSRGSLTRLIARRARTSSTRSVSPTRPTKIAQAASAA